MGFEKKGLKFVLWFLLMTYNQYIDSGMRFALLYWCRWKKAYTNPQANDCKVLFAYTNIEFISYYDYDVYSGVICSRFYFFLCFSIFFIFLEDDGL